MTATEQADAGHPAAADQDRPGEAVVFPGMGPSPYADVAKFMLTNPLVRRRVAEAEEVLGYPLLQRYREAAGDYTEYAQVAFLINSLALADWAGQQYGAQPQLCAGPSFGGKAAAVFSGALSFAEAVDMTARWARALEDYFTREHTDLVTLSFARTPAPQLAEVLAELRAQGEWCDVTCLVDADFAMVTLREQNIEWLQKKLRSVGGLPLYLMRPPMHSPAFAALRDEVEATVFADLHFADPRIPVVADQDGSLRTTADGVRQLLLDGFVRQVRWPVVIDALLGAGVGTLYVCGADSLFGRVGVTTRNFTVVAANPAAAMRSKQRPVPA